MFSSAGKGGFPIRHPNHAHACPRWCYGLMTSLHSHGDRDQAGSSPPMCHSISTWRWVFLGDIQLLVALARRFLHFESVLRLSETCLERSGESSLVACGRLVLVCALCLLTLPGCRGRFCSSDEALPEYKLRIVFVANGFYWQLGPISRGEKAKHIPLRSIWVSIPPRPPYFRREHEGLMVSCRPLLTSMGVACFVPDEP